MKHLYQHFDSSGKPRPARHIYDYATPSIGDAPCDTRVKHTLHVLRRLIDRRARPYRVKKAWRRFQVALLNASAVAR